MPYLLNVGIGDLIFGISIFYSYIATSFLYLPQKNDWIDVDRYMYKGSYLNQDVAIKVLKDEHQVFYLLVIVWRLLVEKKSMRDNFKTIQEKMVIAMEKIVSMTLESLQ